MDRGSVARRRCGNLERGMSASSAFLEATVRTATPLLLAAEGELLVERSGLINIGLEGVILMGAFGGLLGAGAGGTALGYVAGALAGVLVALVFALFVLWVRADQVITGTAITLLSLGITGTLYQVLYGTSGASLSIPTSGPLMVPLLARVPLIGRAFFAQPAPTYFAYAIVPALWWWLHRTHAGLALRAVGESISAVEAAGISVRLMRLGALVTSGALGGLAGATLVIAQAGTFAEGMSAGRGFIAIAIVVLGRWSVGGVALAALLFGAGSALQFLSQAAGLRLPYQLFLALPYGLTLAALAGVAGRVRAPEGLGRADTA
jgi:general nucleoside transport system permease protein